jgi:hypothetical protein
MSALQTLEDLLLTGPELQVEELQSLLQTQLCTQLGDLRSQVVQKACSVVVTLATREHVAPCASNWFIEALLDNTSKTVRVIADASSQALRSICIVGVNDEAQAAIVGRMNDKHRVIRRNAAECLFLIIESAKAPHCADEMHDGSVEVWSRTCTQLASTITDPDKQVRFAGRLCVVALKRRYPKMAETVYEADSTARAHQYIEEAEVFYDRMDDRAQPINYSVEMCSKAPVPPKRESCLRTRIPLGKRQQADISTDVLVLTKKQRSPSTSEPRSPAAAPASCPGE